MANYSITNITITKNSLQNEQIAIDNLEQFKEEFNTFIEESSYNNIGWINPTRLQKNDSASERAKYSTAQIYSRNEDNNKIELFLGGRWCSPSQLFIDLCKKYKLNLHYVDRENGCNFTHIVIMENGKVKTNRQNEYISALAIKHCKDEVFDEIIEIFEESEWFYNNDNIIRQLKAFFADEDYSYLKKELRISLEYKNFLKYAKDFYDRP